MSFTLQDVQEVVLTISGVDAAGNPAVIKGSTWDVSDKSVLNVTPSADGTSCTVSTTGKLGKSQVKVTAKGPQGDVHGLLDVDVVGSDAVAITVNPGTATGRKNLTPTPGPVPAPVTPPVPPSPVGPAPTGVPVNPTVR